MLMKVPFIVFVICFCFNTSWSQSDDSIKTDNPKILQIGADGLSTIDSLSLTADFTVFSLVSIELYNNWDEAELKRNFGRKSGLIVVSRTDSDNKTRFVTSFYRNWLNTGSKKKGYELTIKEMGSDTDIKHLLILNE
jgi:hypothetical protein